MTSVKVRIAHDCIVDSPLCCCRAYDTEPRKRCEVHGEGRWLPRCRICSKFMKLPIPEPVDEEDL